MPAAAWWDGAKLHDLSLPVQDGAPSGFGLDPPRLTLFRGAPGRRWWGTRVCLTSHTGTHVDAPRHWKEDGQTVDQWPLEKLVGMAWVADLRLRHDPRRIQLADLQRSRPPFVARRWLLATGWDRQVGEPSYFTAYPSLDLEAVEWLVEQGIALLGTDTPSLNRTANEAAHLRLLGAGIVVVESMAALAGLAGQAVWVAVLPLRLVGADAAPCRAVALQWQALTSEHPP